LILKQLFNIGYGHAPKTQPFNIVKRSSKFKLKNIMQKFKLFILTVIFPAIAFTQEFKPLLDPTVACSYGSPDNSVDFETNKTKLVDYFFIVEEMPKPKVSFTKIENMLKEKVLFIEKELKENSNILIQCLVNCEGKAGDYQIIHCPTEMGNICCQILEVLKNNFTEWNAGIQKKNKVDVLVKMEINIDKGKIKIINI